jgi:hypothetical protein
MLLKMNVVRQLYQRVQKAAELQINPSWQARKFLFSWQTFFCIALDVHTEL